MNVTLRQVLALVGRLDDSPEEDCARERFRRYLRENVTDVGTINLQQVFVLRKSSQGVFAGLAGLFFSMRAFFVQQAHA